MYMIYELSDRLILKVVFLFLNYRRAIAMNLNRQHISVITVVLYGLFSPSISYAERLSVQHLYMFAKNRNEQMLSKYQRWINMEDENQNTALCISVEKNDRNSYFLLKKCGANTQSDCMQKY